jgi:hypothetical protein
VPEFADNSVRCTMKECKSRYLGEFNSQSCFVLFCFVVVKVEFQWGLIQLFFSATEAVRKGGGVSYS